MQDPATGLLDSAPLTLALAMAAGVTAQAVSRHLRLPGIVVLLAVGVLLGPDVADVVRPATMGDWLQIIVGFAVAVILFDGGLNLRVGHLRSQAKPIRRLVTVGAIVTGTGGALAAKVAMGWSWQISILFGTLVIVTGPTVITPLLKRIRLEHGLATILEAEGIFIDAVGATIAVVALEVALASDATSLGLALPNVLLRIGGGAVIGGLGGALLALSLRRRNVIPRGLENILTLAYAVAVFQISNAVLHESGITAAIVAGFVVGNVRSHALGELTEFKEQLTVLLIATLFVLLAADVRVADVVDLGIPGVLTVALLMFVVRPLTVLASTAGTDVTTKERMFLSWLAPRGIVAAAVASLFAISLQEHGVEGGVQMRALVFLVIATTVTLQGITGGPFARLLGLKRATNLGFLFLGSNALSRQVGTLLAQAGEEVVFIDANAMESGIARGMGFTVHCGNGLDEKLLTQANADARTAVVGITPNESVNMLFARHIDEQFHGPAVYVGLEPGNAGVTDEMLEAGNTRLLFGEEAPVRRWVADLDEHRCTVEWWVAVDAKATEPGVFSKFDSGAFLPLIVLTKGKVSLVDATTRLKPGGEVAVLVLDDRRADANAWLGGHGFTKRMVP